MSCAFVAILMVDQEKAAELAELVAARGARPFVAASTDSLYEKAGEESIDVLVIENRLQSFLTGMEIIRHLQADFAKPVTVLLADESLEEDEAVQRLGLFHLGSTTETVEALVEMTLTAAEKSLLNRPPVCPRAQRIVSQLEGIRPLNPLILKIAASLRESPAAPEALFRDIAADPMASAAVLRIVNSSAIGRSQKTTNVEEGIRFLGLRRTISAVLSAGLTQAQETLLTRAPKEVRRWYNHRNVLIASVAETFSRNLEQLPPETAYIHGLLQDAGVLVLAQTYGDRYVQLLERVQEIPHLRLEAEERHQFGTTHADVTAALLRRLKLPESLAVTTGRHHAPIPEPQWSEIDQSLVRVMQIGEATANICDRPTPQRLTMLNYLLAHYRGHDSGICQANFAEAIKRVAELSYVLGLPAPDDQALAELAENIKLCDQHAPEADFDPYPAAQPFEKAPEGAANRISTAPTPPRYQSKILVLDDDPAIAKFIRNTLARVGADVVHATNTGEALERVDEFDAVLCDVHIGTEDGVDAIDQLRAAGFHGPVIIISGDGCRSTVERALKVRINDYLLKPFSTAQLIEKLQRHPGLVSAPGSTKSKPDRGPSTAARPTTASPTRGEPQLV